MDFVAPDGTVTTKGVAIRLYRQGEGTVIRDAGWVRFLEDGLVVRGPIRLGVPAVRRPLAAPTLA
jgi:hypothetical protein